MSDQSKFSGYDIIDGLDLLAQLYGSPREVVTRYTSCALCGSKLHFSHITDFANNLTQETARCPECGIRIRRVMHKLQ